MGFLEVKGIVEADITPSEFMRRFVAWVEGNGWAFCGLVKPFRDGDCVPGRALGQRCHCAADVDEELRYKRIALAFKLLEHAMHDAELADILDGTAVVLKRAEEV